MLHHYSLFMHPLFHIVLREVNRSCKGSSASVGWKPQSKAFGNISSFLLHPFCSVWTCFFSECELVLPVLCAMVVVRLRMSSQAGKKTRLKHDLCVPWDKDCCKNETLQISYQPPSGWGLTLSKALCKIPPTTSCNTQMFTCKGSKLGKRSRFSLILMKEAGFVCSLRGSADCITWIWVSHQTLLNATAASVWIYPVQALCTWLHFTFFMCTCHVQTSCRDQQTSAARVTQVRLGGVEQYT